MTAQRIYNFLVRLYPAEYRALFGAEMSAVFDMTARGRRREGFTATAGLFLVETTSLLTGAAREWIAKLAYAVSHSVNYIDGRCLPDPLLMRPPGVSWAQHYGWGPGRTTGLPGDPCSACLNAYQTFALASPFRRLAIITLSARRCRHWG
jgi:hypothetical protein